MPTTLERAGLRPGGAARLGLSVLVLFAGGLVGAAVTPIGGEASLLAPIAGGRTPTLTTVAHVVTTLGDLWFVSVAAVVVVSVVGAIARSWRSARPVLLLLALTIGGSTLIVGALKLVVARPRPTGAVVTTLTSAYPSGHAVRAAAVYGLAVWACHRYVRRPLVRAAAVVATGSLAVAIVLSRLYLGVHLASDVAAGAVIGGLWLAAVLRAVRAPPGRAEAAVPDAAPEGR